VCFCESALDGDARFFYGWRLDEIKTGEIETSVMAVTIETLGACRKRLRVQVDAERVAGTRAEILGEYRKQASIPGFRPGKAPEPMVEKRYAHEIDEEVRKRLVPDSYREALLETKLHVVGYPQVESVEYKPGQPLVYAATVDTAPEFNLPDYKGIPVKKQETPVTDEDVSKTIDALREQHAEFIPIEGRGAQMGDFVVINYSGVADGKPIAGLAPEARTLGEHKDFWLLMAGDSFLPRFCDQLVGALAGEKRQVLVDFPADFPQAGLAGHKATYFVDVTGLKQRKLPELGDEFAKKVGLESAAKLQEEVRKGLTLERESEAKADLRKQIVDHLLGRVEFELPESLVAQETRTIVYDLVRENSQRGVTKETLEEKKDEIFGYATKSAKERLRTSFILDAIAKAEGIKVEANEMEERIAQMARRNRVPPEKLKAQLDERDGLAEIEEQILVGKTLDFLLSNATVNGTARS
jgi:trigger factor